MTQIRELAWDERLHIDAAFFEELTLELGVDGALAVIDDAISTMAADLSAIDAACAEQNLADLVTFCDGLSRVAWELGLTGLSAVAVDLALCAEGRDMIALAAVHARLRRIGMRSLAAAWDEAAIG